MLYEIIRADVYHSPRVINIRRDGEGLVDCELDCFMGLEEGGAGFAADTGIRVRVAAVGVGCRSGGGGGGEGGGAEG